MAASPRPKFQVIMNERTHRDSIRFSLKWTIDNFITFENQTEDMFNTGITMTDLGQDVARDYQGRWRIRVTPCHTTTEGTVTKKYVSVFLLCTDGDLDDNGYTGRQEICTDSKIRVSTGKSMDVVIMEACLGYHAFAPGRNGRGFSKVLTHQRLFGTTTEQGLIKDDCITIVMDVLLYKPPKTSAVTTLHTPSTVRQVSEFVRRQLEWLGSQQRRQYTDFILLSNDNREFHVHRFALMVHSPVFEAMFAHDLKEKLQLRCELEDIDGESVEVLLDYVYGCDTEKVNSGNAEKVLIMADKYEMVDLRDACEQVLVDNIPAEKAVHYLVLASLRGLSKLREAALSVMPKAMATVLKNGGLDEALQYDSNLLVTVMEYCSEKVRVIEEPHTQQASSE